MTDITPPSELVQQLYGLPQMRAIEKAYQAGADQELDACCELMDRDFIAGPSDLRAARRPRPPSLKELALQALDAAVKMADDVPPEGICSDQADIIRRALNQLPDS